MIQRVVTSGVFSLDGEDFDVDNNVWLIGDEREVLIIDAAHDHRPIVEAVAGRRVTALVLTHGHNDHVNAAGALADSLDVAIWLHPADLELWHHVYPHTLPDGGLEEGQRFEVGGVDLSVRHTPGHSPGGCCLYSEGAAVVFTGDTLFSGGPGATGRSFSDRPTLIASIRSRLLTLPSDTRVLTGHGEETTIGREAPAIEGA